MIDLTDDLYVTETGDLLVKPDIKYHKKTSNHWGKPTPKMESLTTPAVKQFFTKIELDRKRKLAETIKHKPFRPSLPTIYEEGRLIRDDAFKALPREDKEALAQAEKHRINAIRELQKADDWLEIFDDQKLNSTLKSVNIEHLRKQLSKS